MATIRICIVDKKGKDHLYAPLIEHYRKVITPFAKIELVELFDKRIAKAHEEGPEAAKRSYSEAFRRCLSHKGYHVALDPFGKELDSQRFADILKDKSVLHFYIGGAYGLEQDLIAQCDLAISFGKMTLSHKLIKVVLMEQIFRGLSINRNHPYHK